MPRQLKPLAAIALCVLVTGSHDLAAQDKDAAAHLADASSAFDDGRFDDANTAIAAGLALEPANHSLLRLRGEILLARRDFEGALAAYEAYLEAKPRGANRRKARKIIANLAASRTTLLELTVSTGPANIYLDSKSIGVYCVAAPTCKKGMLPGRYRVFVEREGFAPVQQEVRLRLGKTEALAIELVENPSSLTVTAVPADAAITVDGKPLEAGAAIEVPAGQHEVEATLAGFVTATQTIEASEGKPVELALSLAERVAVSANVEAAAFTLDGQPVTLEDGAIAVPSDGAPHTIVATSEGFKEATVTLAPDRGRGQPVTLTLEKIPAVIAPPREQPPAQVSWSRNRKILFVGLLGLSATGVIAGSLTGLSASSKWGDAEDRCDGAACDRAGLDLIDDARSSANLSNISFGVGLAALVGATAVYLTAPRDVESSSGRAARSSTTVSPTVSTTSSSVGMTVRMSF